MLVGCSKEQALNLSQEQIEFLQYISIDEKRIESGKLYDWQINLLDRYDKAETYLKGKYPSHKFKITNWMNNDSYETFWFTGDEQDGYELYMYEDGTCKDDFWCNLDTVRNSYIDALQGIIGDNVDISIKFNTAQGEEFNENITGQDIINKNNISNTVSIKINNKDQAEKIKNILESNSIYGSYYIEYDEGKIHFNIGFKIMVDKKSEI